MAFRAPLHLAPPPDPLADAVALADEARERLIRAGELADRAEDSEARDLYRAAARIAARGSGGVVRRRGGEAA